MQVVWIMDLEICNTKAGIEDGRVTDIQNRIIVLVYFDVTKPAAQHRISQLNFPRKMQTIVFVQTVAKELNNHTVLLRHL